MGGFWKGTMLGWGGHEPVLVAVHDGGEDLVHVGARADDKAEHQAQRGEVEQGRLARRVNISTWAAEQADVNAPSLLKEGRGARRWSIDRLETKGTLRSEVVESSFGGSVFLSP